MSLKIQIVTPSFNRAWCVQTCINSIVAQGDPNCKHLIVDNCSDDGTLEIVRNAAQSNPHISFVSQPDRGLYDAINFGFQRSTADVLGYLNTDDFLLPGALLKVRDLFEQDENLMIVYGQVLSWNIQTDFVHLCCGHRYSPVKMATFGYLPQPSVFFRRSIFERFGPFDLSYRLAADNDFFVRALASGMKAVYTPMFLSAQTIHSSNLLNNDNAQALSLASREISRYRKAAQVIVSQEYRLGTLRLFSARLQRPFYELSRKTKIAWFLLNSQQGRKMSSNSGGGINLPRGTTKLWKLLIYCLPLSKTLFGASPYSYFKVNRAAAEAWLGFRLPMGSHDPGPSGAGAIEPRNGR